jgi:hypothetical protein
MRELRTSALHIIVCRLFKGHGIVRMIFRLFSFIIHKSVWHISITQLLSLYGFGFELADIIEIDNRLPAINNTGCRRLRISVIRGVDDSPFYRKILFNFNMIQLRGYYRRGLILIQLCRASYFSISWQ